MKHKDYLLKNGTKISSEDLNSENLGDVIGIILNSGKITSIRKKFIASSGDLTNYPTKHFIKNTRHVNLECGVINTDRLRLYCPKFSLIDFLEDNEYIPSIEELESLFKEKERVSTLARKVVKDYVSFNYFAGWIYSSTIYSETNIWMLSVRELDCIAITQDINSNYYLVNKIMIPFIEPN